MEKRTEKICYKKEFLRVFNSLCAYRSSWQVWSDFVVASACAIANSIDRGRDFETREKEYAECVERLGGVEKASELFAYVVLALEENPNRDFLGELYMELNLGNHWKGQFFTPISLCRLMSEITLNDKIAEIEKGAKWISVNDCACGAGATLISAVDFFKSKGVSYYNRVLFIGQDVDRITGLMCFVQLSLLGCAGYIVIGDTLSRPCVAKSELLPYETEGQELWYMPMFANAVWEERRRYKWLCDFVTDVETPNETRSA